MADLSKVKLNGTAYNLKDSWARENLQTASDVNTAITEALGDITEFSISVLAALPASGEAGVFYFIPNSGSGNNIYDEYVWVNNTFEKIGSTEIDLSNYLQTTDIAAWAKAANKPTYTASEVGALPSNTTYVSSVNGQTGAVIINIPDDVSDITNAVPQALINDDIITAISNVNDPDDAQETTLYVGDSNSASADHQESSINVDIYGITIKTVNNNGVRIHNVVTPTANTDAANKAYVDNAVAGITVPQRYNASTNPTGYLTINDLPLYDGSVSNPS